MAVGELDARVVSETSTVATCPAWLWSRAIFCPATTITPMTEAHRWTRMGSGNGVALGQLGGRGMDYVA